MKTNPEDEAMLAYLAGDQAVTRAARQIWAATGGGCGAQRDLNRATKGYQAAITNTGIPAAHVERLGAALILRLHRNRQLDETANAEP